MGAYKNILVCVLGSTPQILTETLWYLNVKEGIVISDIMVITTSYGKKLICDGDEKTGMPSLLNEVFKKFCDEFGLRIKFDAKKIRVITDGEGNELEDIRDSRQNEIAADFIIREIRNIINKYGNNVAIHCSVAGGRKTMSVYAALALTLVGRGQDRLYHVLVSPPEIEGNPKFFYKPKAPSKIILKNGREITTDEIEITLAEIPFLRLGEKYRNIFPSEISYVELVRRISEVF